MSIFTFIVIVALGGIKVEIIKTCTIIGARFELLKRKLQVVRTRGQTKLQPREVRRASIQH